MSSEKTEKATPKRREKARRDGRVAKSNDFSAVVVTTTVAASLVFTAVPLVQALLSQIVTTLERIAEPPTPESLPEILIGQFVAGALAVTPILAVAFLAAALVTYLQVGPVFTVKPLVPDTQRMNPAEGLKKMVSKDRLVDLLKNSGRLLVIGWVAFVLYRSSFAVLHSMTGRSLKTSLSAALDLAASLGGSLLGVLLCFGVIDLLWQRHTYEESLLMTKQEVKDEYKESEGDPMLKGKRKRLHQQMLREANIGAVRNADAVVVNPTHIAVALKYDAASRGAPHLVARGRGDLAQRMRDEARKWNVPIVHNVPLARGLVDLELDEEVPETLYEAVAEVLKFVYSIKRHP